MYWQPREDADALVESALAGVCLDGANVRCPHVVFRLFGIHTAPLPPGEIKGSFSLERALATFCMVGTEAEVRGFALHECGHMVLCIHGRRLPHDESLASRCGRAIALSRPYVLATLDQVSFYEAVSLLSVWIPEGEVERRIWEVRRTVRRVG